MPTGRLGGEPALNAAWVFRNGGSEEEALRMVTLNAAEMLGVADQVGSLDVGKDADFMILEGHPLDYRVLPQMVFVDGRQVVNKTDARPSVREPSSGPRSRARVTSRHWIQESLTCGFDASASRWRLSWE